MKFDGYNYSERSKSKLKSKYERLRSANSERFNRECPQRRVTL